MAKNVQIDLTADEALVLFEWLSQFDLQAASAAERSALDGLLAALERTLVEPFRADYAELVAAARARLLVEP